MSQPKRHHFVPQFYLRNFADADGLLNVWDKTTGRVSRAQTRVVAAQSHFCKVPELIDTAHDPLFLEKDFARLEGDVARILSSVLELLEAATVGSKIPITPDQRGTFAWFIATQYFRSAEQRSILALYAEASGTYKEALCAEEAANLHAQLLATGEIVDDLSRRVFESIWIYARNESGVPFWTSDAPVAIKTGDNRMWLKGPGILAPGTYIVFPLTPKYILYCKEPVHWANIKRFESCLSPVAFTNEMVEHQNAGQVFMATRHVMSPDNAFGWANTFVKTIGEDESPSR